MTGVEIILIFAGLVLMIGSFLVTEKLSDADLDKIAGLSEKDIKRILEKRLQEAENSIEDQIDATIDDSMNKVERALDKETNEKMKAINDYSDTVLENMNKTHNEIMFLYSMLNDKHTELTDLSIRLEQMSSGIEQKLEQKEQLQAEADTQTEEIPAEVTAEETPDEEVLNHNERILSLYRDGASNVEIARNLGLGLGEVKLVIELYKGDMKREV